MAHGILTAQLRRLRHDMTGARVPVVIGLLVILVGIASSVLGCMVQGKPTPDNMDKQTELVAMSLVGGFYLVLTGLWFMTRPSITERRVMGLLIMIVGVVAGTWFGIFGVAQNEDGQAANVIFMAGLAVHLVGVLYARKE